MCRLAGLALLLERWARRINLTAHDGAEAICRRLILDAAALWQVVGSYEEWADLGSGAGFPGLPIAILEDQAPVHLVESRERRHHFQRAAVREIGVPNADPLLGRAEVLDPKPSAAVVAQAVAGPGRIHEWMRRWARPGALLIVPGSTHFELPGDLAGLEDTQVRKYQVPLGGPERRIWSAQLAL